MRSLSLTAFCALLGIAPGAGATEEVPRGGCAAEARQFDFWVGRWNVTEKGKPAGVNHIEPILGGCALLENWAGAKGGMGKSLNFFDRGDGLWHQAWIDGSGDALFLAGRFENGVMRMQGERPASGEIPPTRHRITWTPLSEGKLRQVWESTPIGKEVWTVVFDGLYEPANKLGAIREEPPGIAIRERYPWRRDRAQLAGDSHENFSF